MPMPKPNKGEKLKDFVERFMADEGMIEEYEDEDQRYAVCMEEWKKGKEKKMKLKFPIYQFDGLPIDPEKHEQKILVFPRGEFYFEKYQQSFTFDQAFFDDISKAFDSTSLSKPVIDKDHEFKTSYGDLLGYEVTDAGMSFTVNLNPKGIELIKNREYTRISPAWGPAVDNAGTKWPNRLSAVSLVNFPAFEGVIPELQAQLELKQKPSDPKNTKEEPKVTELYVLANELNLNKEASVDSILASVKTLKGEKIELEKLVSDTKTALKAAEDKAIQLSNEMKDIKESSIKKEASAFIVDMIGKGKIIPAVQDIWLSRYISDPEGVKKEMGLIPEKSFAPITNPAQNSSPVTLSKEDNEKMKIAGLDTNSADDIKVYLDRKTISAFGGAK